MVTLMLMHMILCNVGSYFISRFGDSHHITKGKPPLLVENLEVVEEDEAGVWET